MKIYVDADSCPTVIKDILVRAAIRVTVPIVFIANQPVKLPESDIISMIIVEAGPDIADDKIVELVSEGDLVISEDIPLADRVIDKEAYVFSTRGDPFTKENIKQKLATRDLLNELRSVGVETGGPNQLGQKDVRSFANQLDRFLTKYS